VADYLVNREAGSFEKGPVGENDRITGLPRIGDDHRHLDAFKRRRGQRAAVG